MNRGEEEKENESKAAWWQAPLVLFGKFSGWILAPLFIGVLLGRWLDRKFDTAPWIFLSVTLFSFIISIIGLVITALKDIKKIENKNNER